MLDDQVLTSARDYAVLKHRIVGGFTSQHREAAELISRRLPAVEKRAFELEAPNSCRVIAGLPLYSRLLQDLLYELAQKTPDWRRVLQLQRWIELIERGAGVKHG